MWSVSGSEPMGGRPKAFPTPAMAGSISLCVNVPVWFLSRLANFSSTNLDQVWSFSTNAFKAFPSITVAIFAANHDVLCRMCGTTVLPEKLHRANEKQPSNSKHEGPENACQTSERPTSQTIIHSNQHKHKVSESQKAQESWSNLEYGIAGKNDESEKKRTKSRTVR